MTSDFLGSRKKGLEEAFFAEQDARVRRKLREADEAQASRDTLAAASGISDAGVLDRLAALGISGETLAALSLTPMVLVAWADGEIDDKERAAVLSGAEQMGLARGAPSHQLLESWLTKHPPATLLASWKDYVAALAPTLDAAARDTLKTETLHRARAVAEATGGFLGLGSKVSDAEQSVLTELERSFDA